MEYRRSAGKQMGHLGPLLAAGLAGAAVGWLAVAATVMLGGPLPVGWWPEAWRYADTGLPMISSADGFYYMHLAEQALENGFAGLPPFAQLTAALAKVFSLRVETVAFYSSLLFHLLLGVLAAGWSRLAGAGRVGAFLAALAAALMPGWLERGGPGRFDTDLPILLFWQAGLFFLVMVGKALGESRSFWRPGLAALGLLALLAWIWEPGLGLALGTLAIWLFVFLPRRIWGIKPRLIIASGALICLALAFLLPPGTVPVPKAFLDLYNFYFSLAFGMLPDLFYTSIKELDTLTTLELLEKIGGSAAGGLAVLAVGLAAAVKFPLLRFPLLLGLCCLLAGLRSNRLVYLGLYPLALSLGFLPRILRGWIAESAPATYRAAAWLLSLALFSAVAGGCLHWAAARELDIRWEGGHDRLLEALRREHQGQGQAWLWNWWDDGYFLAARLNNMKPLFDGGSQTHIMAYIAARPFVMEDREAAARWMRFFAVRGGEGLWPLMKVWGTEGAWNTLETLLTAGPEKASAEDLAKIEGGADWIFPQGRVYWYVPGYFHKISNWWLPLGLSLQPDKNLVRPHIDKIRRDQFAYDDGKKSLVVAQELWDRGYKNFGLVINTGEQPLVPPWPRGGDPYIVYSDKNEFAYIVDELGLKTLPLYVAAPGGDDLPKFRPVAVDNQWGGVWEVLP